MSAQLRHMITIPDAQYHELMSDLKAGKKAYLFDRVGKRDRVELCGSDNQIFEISTKRLVVAQSTLLSNRLKTKAVSLWGKLVVAFGNPVMARKPTSTSTVDNCVAWICVDRSRNDTPILIYNHEQKVLMLPGFWNAIGQWKALFGDVFHRDITLSAIFNDSDAPAAQKRVARLIEWE